MNSTLTAVAAPEPDPFDDLAALFDADAATDSVRVSWLRAVTPVADLLFSAEDTGQLADDLATQATQAAESARLDAEEGDIRAQIVADYVTARARRDLEAMGTAYLDAAAMDEARPGESSLVAELDASGVGDLAAVA